MSGENAMQGTREGALPDEKAVAATAPTDMIDGRTGPRAPLRFSDDAYRRIEREAAKYPPEQRQSAVMASLAIAQRELGWISAEVIDEVARVLRMPPIAVHEVATFYTMYAVRPTGRHKISVCTNLPCALRDANKASEYLKGRLGIGFGETTEDGAFTLQEGECMGACGDAPVLLVNNERMESFMDFPKLDALLDELRAAPAAGRAGNGA